MLLDTGSPALWLYWEEGCEDTGMCPDGRNNFFKGNSSSSLILSGDVLDLAYGIGQFVGYKATDTLWLSENYALENPFEFVLVNRATNAENYVESGFLGLSPESFLEGIPTFWQ